MKSSRSDLFGKNECFRRNKIYSYSLKWRSKLNQCWIFFVKSGSSKRLHTEWTVWRVFLEKSQENPARMFALLLFDYMQVSKDLKKAFYCSKSLKYTGPRVPHAIPRAPKKSNPQGKDGPKRAYNWRKFNMSLASVWVFVTKQYC